MNDMRVFAKVVGATMLALFLAPIVLAVPAGIWLAILWLAGVI